MLVVAVVVHTPLRVRIPAVLVVQVEVAQALLEEQDLGLMQLDMVVAVVELVVQEVHSLVMVVPVAVELFI